MITFKKYNSIENTYDKEYLDKIRLEIDEAQEFVVQEKVHGANFCFLTDGIAVKAGKRTSIIEENELFYGYEALLEKYSAKVVDLFSEIKKNHNNTIAVSIFGEYFGGNYPHSEVKNDRSISAIQKGVYYCPEHEFYAFDIYINTNTTGYYLSVDEANKYFESANFIFAKTLFRGTLNECLQYPNEFTSKVSEWLHLPSIENNICEGVVIRPVEVIYLHNGSRLLLKNKNSKFAEKKSVKKHQPKLFVEITYSNELQTLLLQIEDYVNENRLNNVVSKIGQISIPRDTGKVIGLLSKDILDDFLKEHSNAYALLEKSEQKILNKHINMLATDLIKTDYFKH